MNTPHPVIAGISGRCPRCGEGRLFSGFLKFADTCESCGLDISAEDAGDGPAVFIILIVGFIVVPLALALELALEPPLWLHVVLWLPLALGLCVALLRPFRGVMFTLQWHHSAREARLDQDDS
ncbi:DUF983 domain-containing protein [Glycocaulis sp.]|uniref:DUF983 domain-containing protein n=1 Tax=Glycocaulis sp. TaxID=1969725 RepID=UPI003D232EBB